MQTKTIFLRPIPFKRALECISQYDRHQHILEDDELINHCIRELDEIVKMPKPYSRIKDIPPLSKNSKSTIGSYCPRRKKKRKSMWKTPGQRFSEELSEKIDKAENLDGIGDIKAQSKTRLYKSFTRINKKLE